MKMCIACSIPYGSPFILPILDSARWWSESICMFPARGTVEGIFYIEKLVTFRGTAWRAYVILRHNSILDSIGYVLASRFGAETLSHVYTIPK